MIDLVEMVIEQYCISFFYNCNSPPFSSHALSPFLCFPLHSSSISLQKRAGLPWIPTKHRKSSFRKTGASSPFKAG